MNISGLQMNNLSQILCILNWHLNDNNEKDISICVSLHIYLEKKMSKVNIDTWYPVSTVFS